MRKHQRGVAVVLAMGVVALAAITTTAIMVSQSTWARQSELMTDHSQAQSLARAGVDWARAVLSNDRNSSNVDHLGEPWALKLAPIPVDNGEITGAIEDQQGAFNLNNLVSGDKTDPAEVARFRRLLLILDLPASLADALVDWLDVDAIPSSASGAEDAYYLGLTRPYLAANQPLTDVAELALVRGFDDRVRARLRPFVTALPRSTPINVNTASAEVIAATFDGMDIDVARALVAQRNQAYFSTMADIVNRLSRKFTLPSSGVALSSEYFIVTIRVSIGDTQARSMALLARDGPGWPAIVWQKNL